MIEKDADYQSAGKYAWFAMRDASMKSAVNSTHFSDFQKTKAERIKYALELVYSSEEISITFCKKWVRIKVHNGTVKDKKNLALLESDWACEGITKLFTNQGIIYRLT